MHYIAWFRPVTLKLHSGIRHDVRSPYDALDFLNAEWPVRRGNHYAAARERCRNALTDPRETEAAREAMIAAALEAGVLCTETNRMTMPAAMPVAANSTRATAGAA
ncbi:DUF982 domain-containing protein [Rhizobium sp. RU20A]|uniref:DUF982 domain-containing protein n=1 Tax=Rhizobium sp. RU20A TaxID=1907412 RepID=UPI001FCEB9B0|nr:DUF982 domain-containing protein [Rhizobium sp. RU20A]